MADIYFYRKYKTFTKHVVITKHSLSLLGKLQVNIADIV